MTQRNAKKIFARLQKTSGHRIITADGGSAEEYGGRLYMIVAVIERCNPKKIRKIIASSDSSQLIGSKSSWYTI